MTYFIRRIYTGDQVEVAFGSDQAWRNVERSLRATPNARWIHITNATEKNVCRLACHYGQHCDWAWSKWPKRLPPSSIGRARNIETGEIVEMDFDSE